MQEPRREEDGENKITPNLWKREMDKAASSIWKREGVEADKLGAKREEETRGEERLNMTVTGAEPSSPSGSCDCPTQTRADGYHRLTCPVARRTAAAHRGSL